MAAKGKMLQAIVSLAGQVDSSLGRSFDDVASRLDGLNKKSVIAGAAIAAGVLAIGVGVAKGVGALAQLGDEYNVALNDLQASIGATDAEMEGLDQSLKNIYAAGYGESFDDVSDAMATVAKNTKLSGVALEEVTEGAFALQDAFEYDITESSRAAKALMTNFGISGQEAMNLIAAGAQNGLDYSGELLDTISEYSVQFEKVGFSADDMFNILQQGADSGAWNLDKVGDAVKEFSVRAIDGSKTTTTAFETLGLDADATMQAFAAGGDTARDAFQEVNKKLLEMDDAVARDAAGVALYGSMWEDLGVDAIAAMAGMSDQAYDTGDALKQIQELKFDNIGSAFEVIKRQAQVAFLPLATEIAKSFMMIAPAIGQLFETLAPVISEFTALMMPFVNEFLGQAVSFIQQLIPHVSTLMSGIMPVLATLVSSIFPILLSAFEDLVPTITQLANMILPVISSILQAILPVIAEIVQAILPVLASLIQSLLPILQPLISAVMNFLNAVIIPLLEPLRQLISALLPPIASFIRMISQVLSPLIGLVVTITTKLNPLLALLRPVASVLSTIAGLIGKIASFGAGIFDKIGSFAGKVGSFLPGFATGGFTNGLSIAGEDPRYPTEAVISFNPAYRRQNLAYWAQAGRMLGADTMGYSLNPSSSTVVSYDLGGVTFAPEIKVSGDAKPQDIIQQLEEAYPEFIDMLERWLFERGRAAYDN